MHAPTLAQWVGDPAAFTTAYWRRRPGVFRPDGGVRSPFALADVDAALATGFLPEPYVEMTRAEDPLGRDDYLTPRAVHESSYGGFADEKKIRALLDDGATLLMRRIDQWHGPTRDLLARLSAELQRAVEAFCFVTPPGTQGVPLHRDDADVLVLQLNGSKSWRVHEGPADGNWRHGRVDGEPPAEVLRATLRAGEVLYIPRGFAHQAVGNEGLSVHLSLTIREIHMGDLFRSLQKLSAKSMTIETRPLDDAAVLAAATAMLEHVRAAVADLTPEDLVRHARRRKLAALPAPRSPISLTAVAAGHDGPA
ncbi:ribosomal protein L16 Arg81 hydroxylase [Kitasatospora sp. MAA19]|uniref:JmjC domain-containing protein n=1 Tax=Kitasatospora sp. MAA19 TaxID=3035090 RepID=UPI002476D38C|nr:cupin domain-containing protein [Kitasatospora sp. MAA19]MDH6708427.1 ribosomal protein L16 Arg81 hydroxylase [Kitasatospora sp. MAA19]